MRHLKTPTHKDSRSTAKESQNSGFLHGRFRAESLIETTVAVTVFVIMGAAALTLLRSTLGGAVFLQGTGTATNFASDALEGLKNIRDTNALRFASDTNDCWNKLNVTATSDCTDGTAEAIAEGTTYAIHQSLNGPWTLTPVTGPTDTSMDLYSVNGMPWYGPSGITDSGYTMQQSHVCDRSLTIQYADPDGDGTDDYYEATVTVTWTENGASHSVTKEGHIDRIL